MRVLRKALAPIDTSEAASDRSRPVSLVLRKAFFPIFLTAAPNLSVPVSLPLPFRKLFGMPVMSGSASSQIISPSMHSFTPSLVMTHSCTFVPRSRLFDARRRRRSVVFNGTWRMGSGGSLHQTGRWHRVYPVLPCLTLSPPWTWWPCDGCGPYYTNRQAEVARCKCAHGGCTAHLLPVVP